MGKLRSITIEEYYQKFYRHNIPCLTTTFKVLDDELNGFYNGSLVVIAGRPTMRTSELIYAMVANWILGNRANVLMFSASENVDAPFTNMISRCSDIPYNRLTLGGNRLTEDEFSKYSKALERLHNCERALYIECYRKSLSFSALYEKSIRSVREKGVKVIIIDGFQYVRYNEGDNTNLALHLKNLAKQLDLIIIVNAILPSPNSDYGLTPKLNDLGRSETGCDWDIYSDVILGMSSANIEQQKECGTSWDFARGINVEIMKNNFGREGNIIELFYEADRKMIFSYDKVYNSPSETTPYEESLF
jgi:replicative DNA helicase